MKVPKMEPTYCLDLLQNMLKGLGTKEAFHASYTGKGVDCIVEYGGQFYEIHIIPTRGAKING